MNRNRAVCYVIEKIYKGKNNKQKILTKKTEIKNNNGDVMMSNQ